MARTNTALAPSPRPDLRIVEPVEVQHDGTDREVSYLDFGDIILRRGYFNHHGRVSYNYRITAPREFLVFRGFCEMALFPEGRKRTGSIWNEDNCMDVRLIKGGLWRLNANPCAVWPAFEDLWQERTRLRLVWSQGGRHA